MAANFKNDGSFYEQFKKLQEQKQEGQTSSGQPAPVAPEVAAPSGDSGASKGNVEQQAATSDAAASSESPKQDAAPGEQPKFISSSSFEGYKPGYVFKLGDDGLGYYLDGRPSGLWPKETPKPKLLDRSKPVILKSNNPIVNVRGRARPASAPGSNGSAPGAKKAKKEEGNSHYLKELERYRQQSCGADTTHDRPLVK